jgi:DNA-binding transcriptional LysR family regulator
MTLEQLRIFLAVAQELNMTRASERVHLTQPAISAAIAALEDRHATQLFDRVGRRLELTEAGRLLLPEAQAILGRVGDAQRLLTELADLDRGEVRIAASQTVATYWLPPRMARFVTVAPKIQLHLYVGNTAQAAAQVATGEADIAFVEGHVDLPQLSGQTVGGDRIGLYAAAGHPLTQATPTKRDLERAAWVMREAGSGTRDHLEAGLTRLRIAADKLHVALALPSNGAVLEALDGTQFVAGASQLAATARVRAGLIAPIPWPLPPRAFTQLVHRERTLSRALAAFVASLKSFKSAEST